MLDKVVVKISLYLLRGTNKNGLPFNINLNKIYFKIKIMIIKLIL